MSLATSLRKFGRVSNRSIEVIDREIDEELDFHIECRTRDLIESGLSPEMAAAEASRQFGAREKIRRECQSISHGRQFWLLIGLSITIVISTAAIVWMASLLKAAQQRNQQMLALISSLQPAQIDELDLVGEVKDDKGKPVADAKVLLIFKSWPGGTYQQADHQTTTDDQGKFKFEKLYSSDMQNAFLVTVLADGLTMQSEYVVYKPRAKVKSFRFKLKPAIEKTLIVYSDEGQPLGDAVIYPGLRKPKQGSGEYLLYAQNAEAAGFQTDSEGKVKMSLFAVGDKVQLMYADDRQIDFVVDAQPEQKVGLTGDAALDSGIRGKVTTESGEPIGNAKVLLIHKSWPGGRYQQNAKETKTRADGSFSFADCNESDSQEAFLITIIHEGSVLESQYVMKEPGDRAELFDFELASADEKLFLFKDAAGQALKNKAVALSGRTDDQSQEHLIYGMSQGAVSFKTDKDGKVALNFFKAGDSAKLSVNTGGGSQEVEFVVNDESEQTVELKKKVNPR